MIEKTTNPTEKKKIELRDMTIEFAEKEIQMTYTHTKRLSTWIIITELGSKQW